MAEYTGKILHQEDVEDALEAKFVTRGTASIDSPDSVAASLKVAVDAILAELTSSGLIS